MCHAGEDSRFGHCGVSLVFQDAGDRDVLMAECLDQKLAWLIGTDDAYGQHVYSQVGEVIDGIGSAARNNSSVAMFENEDRGFAGNAGDFSKNKFVCDQVTQHGDRQLGKRLDNLNETVVVAFVHPAAILSRATRRSSMIRSMVSTALGASTRSIFTGTTDVGSRELSRLPRLTASFSVVTKPPASL